MYKRYLLASGLLFLAVSISSVSYAIEVPKVNGGYYVWPFWQTDPKWKYESYAYKYKNATIGQKGCLITSLAMLLKYYGFDKIPDSNYYPDFYNQTTPLSLDTWLLQHRGYDAKGGVQYPVIKNFFYRYYMWVDYLAGVPSCWPIDKSKSYDCFDVKWSDADKKAETFSDYDLYYHAQPDIMQISWTDMEAKPIPKKHDSHFVLISGYDPATKSYRANDPRIYLSYFPWDIAPSLKSFYGENYTKLRILRFQLYSSLLLPRLDYISVVAFSPVELQITDPLGRVTGFDPISGTRIGEMPNAGYREESISSLYSEAPEEEAAKTLIADEPSPGNYILKIMGTGDGPYTVALLGKTTDGEINLDTSVTGTASPGMLETYRVTYSPTGEASLSQTNQDPVANAGPNQAGEQSYEIALDGSGSSDPDGDPLKYTWSFISRPPNSEATLSNVNVINPAFTPDLPGTYILQLVVNDYFTDSAPSTVTVTATPLKSRISVTPNFSQPLSSGATAILFDVNNIGRVGVSSGIISVSLSDPAGVVVYSGSQTFGLAVGASRAVAVPVTIPALKFGNYTLIYNQSDETATGGSTTVIIPNSSTFTFSFDKPSYRMRDTANLALTLTNTGKFNFDNASLTVTVADAGFTDTKTISLGATPNAAALTYAVPIPATISAGMHAVDVTLKLSSGSTTARSTKFLVPTSLLALGYTGPAGLTAGDTINLTMQNIGGVDTDFNTEKVTLTDAKGIEANLANLDGTIMVDEKKTLAIQVPSQTAKGAVMLSVKVKDAKTGGISRFYKSFDVNGPEAGLSTRTDKDIYLNTETITGLSTLTNGTFNIDNGKMDIIVKRYRPAAGFAHFLPKKGWWPFDTPWGTAVGPDGSLYVTDFYESVVYKFDRNGNFITKWGSYGSGSGQFSSWITGTAVSPDGFVYVLDSGNARVQKFDSDGNFILAWGSFDSRSWTTGKFYYPYGIAVAPDSSVYIADTYNNRIQKFDSNGNFISKWGTPGVGIGQFNRPLDIAVGQDGSVLVADSYNHRIQKFDGNGNFIIMWGSFGSGDGQFYYPGGIAVEPDGSFFVSDTVNHRVQRFDSAGTFMSKWGSQGTDNGKFYYPYGITVSADGIVYVADTNNHRVQQFNVNGTFLSKKQWYGTGEGELNSPHGIAIAPEGSMYVADTSNHRIQKFDSNGNLIAILGNRGNGDGQFFNPYSVTVSADGSIYVADAGNHRVQKLNSSGNFIAKWGSYGTGDGQFSTPEGLAITPDGSVYVTDTNNCRIQKFDSSGSFITKWGSCGPTNGQFYFPSSIAAAVDGSVYVADSSNHRIQKFDTDGNFITKWGSYGSGDGQFYYSEGIAVGSDGYVYAADYYNHRIQKFDGEGNFIAKWGGQGIGDGQFYQPCGVAAAPDGAVYVAESGNHRIQRMNVGSSEILFKTTVPINQAADTVQDYASAVGALNATGKLYLEATLKNNLGQTIANAEYPFYIIEGNTVLLFSTDRKVYKPGETVAIAGEVRNLSAIEASNLALSLRKKAEGGTEEAVHTETFSVPAGGSHLFTTTTTAGSDGVVLLTGRVSQNNTKLAEIIDQYEVAGPKVTAVVTAPEAVGNEPFTMNVELKNQGKIEARIQYAVSSSQGNAIDNQSIIIPAGETRLVQSATQEITTTTYTFTFTGDLNQTITKTVAYGLGAGIQFGVQSPGLGVYPEGKVTIPVTITNIGSLDETLSVSYKLTGGVAREETRSYFIPTGGSVTDSLNYELTAGSYQLLAQSSLPTADANVDFSVVKKNQVVMTSTAGTQGPNGLIPVTVNLTNSGYNEINGSITIAVMNNDGKAVWRGEVLVSGLKPQTSGNYDINVDSAGIISGAYPADVVLYSSSALQLASNQTQVRVLGPIFEITSVPAKPAFTVGKQAVMNFAVKNTGTAAGTATFSAKAMDILNQSSAISLAAGEEKPLAFNFTVPEDAEGKDYLADYALASLMSQPTSGKAAFRVNEVKVDVTAYLDKEAYRNGETAVLTLNVSKLSQTEDGTYIAIIRYGTHRDVQNFTLSSQPATLTFNVPLTMITGERLFYGIHFASGNAIYRNSIALNEALADLAAGFSGQAADDGTFTPAVTRDNTVAIGTLVSNYGKSASTETTLALYDGDSLIETKLVRALTPGEFLRSSTVWNVLGKAGNRIVRAVVDPDDIVAEYSEANNTGMINMRVPDMTIFTDTDKETYKIRQKIYITSTVTNLTASTTYTNLLLLTSAGDSSGQEVYNKSLSLGSLGAMNSTTSNQVWNTARLGLDGIYTILQRVFAGSDLMSQSTKTVTLEKAPDFALSTNVVSRKIKQGEHAIYTASIAPLNGWNHEVSFSMEGLPAGASATFNPDRLVPPGEIQTTVATSSTTTAGTYTLYVAGEGMDEGEIVTRTVPLTLDVASFGLDTTLPAGTVKQLETALFPILVASFNGYEGNVSLTVTGLPFGTKASFDSSTVQAPGVSNLSIRSSKYVKPGTYTVTVTGDDGLAKHSFTLTLVLQPNVDIAVGIIATPGPGPQNPGMVRLYNADMQLINEFMAFNSKYGATAITADIDGDGYDEIIVAQGPGPKNKGMLKAFRRDGAMIAEYTAFHEKYGLTLAAADFDGDWRDEIVIGAGTGPQNHPRVAILRYDSGRFVSAGVDFEAFDSRHSNDDEDEHSYGVNVAAGDFDGDHVPEIAVAPGGGPESPAIVRTFKIDTSQGIGLWKIAGNYLAFTAFTEHEAAAHHERADKEHDPGDYGVNIAAGDTDGDGIDEIIVGAGPGPENIPLVKVYKGDGTFAGTSFVAYPDLNSCEPECNNERKDRAKNPIQDKHDERDGREERHLYGVFVGAGDIDGDGKAEIITGLGPGPQNEAHVKVFRADGSEMRNLLAYPGGIKYGVRVSAGNTGRNTVQ